MSPELQQLINDLRNAADDNIIQWQTRRRRWQAVMDMAATKLSAQELELADRRKAETVRMQVRAFSRIVK
jgi:hypothetical protein